MHSSTRLGPHLWMVVVVSSQLRTPGAVSGVPRIFFFSWGFNKFS
jgi:hypothetical protein